MSFGQGADGQGEVKDEGGVLELGLHVEAEELVQELVAGHLGQLGVVGVGPEAKPFQVQGVKGKARLLLQGLHEGDAAEGGLEVEEAALVGDLVASEEVEGEAREELFHQKGHVLVVGVGPVGLQHGELGVVVVVYPLVAEDPADLKDLLVPPTRRRFRCSSKEMRRKNSWSRALW